MPTTALLTTQQSILDAHARCRVRAHDVVFSHIVEGPDLDPFALHAAAHDLRSSHATAASRHDSEPIFLHHRHLDGAGNRAWVVASGALVEVCADGPERFVASGEALKQWRAITEAADTIPIVGGFAFDDVFEHDNSLGPWSAFESTRFWITRHFAVQTLDRHYHGFAFLISPTDDHATLIDRFERHLEWSRSWLAHAVEHGGRDKSGSYCNAQTHEPGLTSWHQSVDQIAAQLGEDSGLSKVVLARAITMDASDTIDVHATLAHLDATFGTCTTFAISPDTSATFLGATPECLVSKAGDRVYVDALAGSASPECSDATLLASSKDRREHALVVDAIREALAPVAELHIPAEPIVDRLANIIHLRTPIHATLRNDPPAAGEPFALLELAARLHPTPAVCGTPRAQALERLRGVEAQADLHRGWYAGAVGWLMLSGDGRFDVALRCALIQDNHARVFVGAGIVADSVGEQEVAETRRKARAIMDHLRMRRP